MSNPVPEERPSQSYAHKCGDGAYVTATLSDAPVGTVFPPSYEIPGKCLLCDAQPVVMRAVTAERLAELDAQAEAEADPPRILHAVYDLPQ